MADEYTSPVTDKTPLVLDVDGTLLRTDLLFETFWLALGTSFWLTLRVLVTCWRRPAILKYKLCEIAQPDMELVPVHEDILARALKARSNGRAVHLASGSTQHLVDALAARFGFTGVHFGSDQNTNLTQSAKAALLLRKFGEGGYDYAGNHKKDLPSWKGARKAIAVTSDKALKKDLSRLDLPVEYEAPAGFSLKALLKELRTHQWVKNVLLFFPLLVMQIPDPLPFFHVAIAAAGFSLGASSIYILNDLLDLSADRIHPEKRHRPIASGALSIPHAMIASVGLACVALGIVWLVSPAGAALTGAYMASSLGYSLWLKKRRWLDVLALATLFTLRVITGAVVAQIAIPTRLLVFVFFTFLVLACVKRMTALTRLATRDHLPGRGYSPRDLTYLDWISHGSIVAAILAFGAFAFSAPAALLYGHPVILAISALPLGLWLLRVVRMSEDGLEDYDPIVFVFKDKLGLVLVALSFLIAFIAI